MQTDRLPPQAIETEESILSTCLVYPEQSDDIVSMLKPKDFYKSSHQVIFSQISKLTNQKAPTDLITVKDALEVAGKLKEIGGTHYLAKLTDYPISLNIEHSCNVLRQKAALRQIIQASYENIQCCYEDPENALNQAQQKILDINVGTTRVNTVQAGGLVLEANERYEEMSKNKGHITGITSGYSALDALTYGFQPSDLIILAARPSMGKTALALNITAKMSRRNRSALFFSLEMSRRQIIDRLISSEAGVNGMKFRSGNFSKEDWGAIQKASDKIYEWPLLIDDSSSLSYREIARRARRAKKNHGIEAVVIDYLQYVTGDRGQTKTYEIESITRGLKGMAKDLEVPVLLLSQLNRQCEQRPHPHKRPVLADLRDSGAIEQDADLVLFIYRPERYDEPDKKGNPQPGIAEINIAKHRNGPLGTVKLKWLERVTRFENQ